MPEKLYTKKEVAEILSCSVATVHRRINDGTLKAVKNGRIVRISESALDSFLHSEPTPVEVSAQLADNSKARIVPFPESWTKK